MTNKILAVILLFGAALAATIHGPAPRYDAWKVIGPGGAGGVFLPTVSPHDPNLVLEYCDMTGAYISLDAGRSWRMFNLRGRVTAFAFDPEDPKAIYAGNSAVWKSSDTGRTWKMLFPDPARNTAESMRDDHAAPVLTSGDPAYPSRARVRHIAVDPVDPLKIYALFEGGKASWLCFSKDGGRNWSRLKEFSVQVVLLYFDRGLRVVTESGVLAMQGDSWEKLAGPPGGEIEFSSGGSGLLYATNAGGIHTSQDGGATWQPVAGSLAGAPKFSAIACARSRPQTAYAAFTEMRLPDGVFLGIAKTTDRGAHWETVYKSKGKSAPNVEDAWIENLYKGTGPIRELGVAPNNPDICFATDRCPRSFRTLDGGRTWQQIICEHVSDDRWTTTGFDVTTSYGVHFDPFRLSTMFISYTDVGLFKSEDAGQSWRLSFKGIPRLWENTTYWVESDPKVKGLMWGAFSRIHDLPRPKMWPHLLSDRVGGGVGTSTDGGDHWTVTNAGLPESAITHILLDPASPVGARTLYACAFGRGVYKSVDNGKSWALKIDGIEKSPPFAWRIVGAEAGALYLVVSRRSDSSYKSDAEDGALYRSTDGAAHWTRMKLPQGVNGPTGLALDPKNNRRIYLSAWGAIQSGSSTGGGVFLSTDAGETWRNVFSESQHVYDVTIDPKNPKVLYNSGFETGAYRSTDGGSTWTRIRGFNFKWGHRVILDPLDSTRIYITTFGGSVWHGPAAGDPQAVEDSLTPVRVGR